MANATVESPGLDLWTDWGRAETRVPVQLRCGLGDEASAEEAAQDLLGLRAAKDSLGFTDPVRITAGYLWLAAMRSLPADALEQVNKSDSVIDKARSIFGTLLGGSWAFDEAADEDEDADCPGCILTAECLLARMDQVIPALPRGGYGYCLALTVRHAVRLELEANRAAAN
jgi:hypothetical protein